MFIAALYLTTPDHLCQTNTTRCTHTNPNPLPPYPSRTYPSPYFYEYRRVSHCVSVSRGTSEALKGRNMRNLTCSQRAAVSTPSSTSPKTKQVSFKYHRLRCQICKHAC